MARNQGGVNDIGRYVSFCKEDGSALSWLQPVKNFMPNGLHAILLAKGPIVRLDMYRFETSYDLLITGHALVTEDGIPKPKLETKLIFFDRFGVLDRELWGKDRVFRGAVAPQFFMSNGSEAKVPHVYQQAVFKMTEAVTCTKCKHQHLLEPPSLEMSVADLESVNHSNVERRSASTLGAQLINHPDRRSFSPPRLGVNLYGLPTTRQSDCELRAVVYRLGPSSE